MAAEQTRHLNLATQKVTEHAYHMQRAMEADDPCSALEKACLLLEELGDPNHGMHHRGGSGARGGPGGGMVSGAGPSPPSYYSTGGAVPPLGNYADRPHPVYGAGGHGSGGGGTGWITPLSPKNYYELHMRAMDEMPGLEEYLLGLCHIPGTAMASESPAKGGPTNYSPNNGGFPKGGMAPYTADVLYETVQYCPRVVPRLYLQICMGAVSIRAGATPAVQVMEELSEAAKCVQCPVRGLFLRYYLLMALKDKLPDGSLDEEEGEDAGEAGDVADGENNLLMSPMEQGEEILGASVASSFSEPTSPPPPLPPPPLPSTKSAALFPDAPAGGDAPLFSESESLFPETAGGEDAPLFSDTPLTEEPKKVAPPSPTPTQHAHAAKGAAAENKTDPIRPRPVVDSYNFILKNLLEMNRLWIRIQHMPGDRTKEVKRRRERERNDLRILVGSNLNRLSQLEGVSAHEYGSKILPRILEEVTSCRDPLAQAYLMDCIIQVFPDEFHLETLEVFLGVCPRLREKVNVRTILTNMMGRLLHYYREEKLVNDEEDTNDVKLMMAMQSFDMFESCVQRVFEARGMSMPPKDIIRLQGCLLNYALKIAPQNVDLIARCISQCARALGTLQEQKRASMMGQGIVLGGGTKKSMEIDMEEVATTELEKLLSVPLDSMGLKVLDMPDFAMLLAFLPWENRGKVALSMAKSVIVGGEDKRVKDAEELEQLLMILAPLLRDEGMAGPPTMYESQNNHVGGGSLISRTANLMGTLGISPSVMDQEDMFGGSNNLGVMDHAQSFGGDAQKIARFREEQALVAKLVHALVHEDTDLTYQLLNVTRRHIQPGGAARISLTMPSVVFAALGLLRRVQVLEFPDPQPVTPKKESAEELKPEKGVEETKESTYDGDFAEESKETVGDGEEMPAAAEGDSGSEKKEGEEKDVDAPAVEEVKEEKAEAKPSPPGAEADKMFPEFTKSVNCRKVLVFLQKSVAMLVPSDPALAFKLYLEIAVATDLLADSTQKFHPSSSGEFCSIAYDFITQAFLVYEDEITESDAQVRAITAIVGSLLSCKTFEMTDYEALITKTAQYAAKLLKKPDQCRMVCLCSRLFYVGGKDDANTYRNPQRVLECLQRGLKIADACSMTSSANVQLFVEILDFYVHYYEIENPAITDKFVSGLIALINEHFDSIGGATGSTAVAEARVYYGQILDWIRRKKAEDGTRERFGLIVC